MALFKAQDQFTKRLLLYISPLSCKRIKASVTAQLSFGSIVKQARSQSNEDPNNFNCKYIRSPFLKYICIGIIRIIFLNLKI